MKKYIQLNNRTSCCKVNTLVETMVKDQVQEPISLDSDTSSTSFPFYNLTHYIKALCLRVLLTHRGK